MNRFQVKYWDYEGDLCRVDVLASTRKEAEKMVASMPFCDPEGSVLMGEARQGSHPGVLMDTRARVREAA